MAVNCSFLTMYRTLGVVSPLKSCLVISCPISLCVPNPMITILSTSYKMNSLNHHSNENIWVSFYALQLFYLTLYFPIHVYCHKWKYFILWQNTIAWYIYIHMCIYIYYITCHILFKKTNSNGEMRWVDAALR